MPLHDPAAVHPQLPGAESAVTRGVVWLQEHLDPDHPRVAAVAALHQPADRRLRFAAGGVEPRERNGGAGLAGAFLVGTGRPLLTLAGRNKKRNS